MNLGQIKSYCAAKLGLTDATTLAQAGEFAKARWAMIWNHAGWRQARAVENLAVTAGQQEVTLPATLELVQAARWGDVALLGLHDLTAYAHDPAGFSGGAPGTPLGFSPMPRTADGEARIRLHRPPAQAGALLVLGKAPCPALADDAATPLISGVDECLCAFVMADLMQWQRQMAKAQAFQAEAMALLAKMVEIETAQSTGIVQLTPLVQTLECDGGGLSDFPG